ncbi:glycosyltransferase family 4 protein [Halobacillus sp. SY10]|uniref:glycosyltransferase family 4 protein n=1 Tax=Halobacillus sp. SY10 TaxID=3381356 RepID=UPI0038798B48
MIIGVDGRKLTSNKTGIGIYLENMLKYIIKNDDNNFYYVFSDNEININFNNDKKNIVFIKVNDLNKIFPNNQIYQPIWLNLILPKYLKKYKVDVFWGPNFLKPITFPAKKSIVTVHDLAFINAKEYHSKFHAMYLKFFLNLIFNKDINIFTVSNYSKQSIMGNFKYIESDQIAITYCSYDRNLFTGNYDSEIRNNIHTKYNLPEKYLLFVGTTTARKNLVNLLYSYEESIKKKRAICKLVVVGAKGNGLENVKEIVKHFNLEEYVIFLGYVETEDLPYIYNMAEVFVFPSFYEGFGIPLLEAMASGTPVISANVTSLPEVAGDAAVYINPSSPENISKGIDSLLSDELKQNELKNNGINRVELFHWELSANVFINKLKDIQLMEDVNENSDN